MPQRVGPPVPSLASGDAGRGRGLDGADFDGGGAVLDDGAAFAADDFDADDFDGADFDPADFDADGFDGALMGDGLDVLAAGFFGAGAGVFFVGI